MPPVDAGAGPEGAVDHAPMEEPDLLAAEHRSADAAETDDGDLVEGLDEPEAEDAAPEAVEPESEPDHAEPEETEPEEAEPEPEHAESELRTEGEPDSVPSERAPAGGWHTLGHLWKPRLTKANLLAGALTLGLGFALVAQLQQTQSAGLESLREDELVRILDDFTQDNLRLGAEIRDLESTRDDLVSGAGSSSQALAAAEARADTLGILAGTRAAQGPGIEMSIADPTGKVTAPLLLDTVEELRDAGAEAIQLNGVRIVASSYFSDLNGRIALSGRPLERPYQIQAIGDSSTMASAMKIPGGVVDTVRGKGGIVVVTEKPRVDITALHALQAPQYARPVPTPSPS